MYLFLAITYLATTTHTMVEHIFYLSIRVLLDSGQKMVRKMGRYVEPPYIPIFRVRVHQSLLNGLNASSNMA
jgi:hypothetical protein